jgi:hypothetical protein
MAMSATSESLSIGRMAGGVFGVLRRHGGQRQAVDALIERLGDFFSDRSQPRNRDPESYICHWLASLFFR